jgi:hypothetical protein
VGRVFRFEIPVISGIWQVQDQRTTSSGCFQPVNEPLGLVEKPGGFQGDYLTFLYDLRTAVIFYDQEIDF